MNEEEFNDRFNELTNLEDIIYYYHITNENVENILENGLYMVEDKIYTTAIEIDNDFKSNPLEYAEKEITHSHAHSYRENAKIVIIGIDKDNKSNLIQDYVENNIDWSNDNKANYYIPSNYIIGYIDVINKDIIVNDNYEYIEEYNIPTSKRF